MVARSAPRRKPLRELVATALVNKGSRSANSAGRDAEMAVYDEVVARFGEAAAD